MDNENVITLADRFIKKLGYTHKNEPNLVIFIEFKHA